MQTPTSRQITAAGLLKEYALARKQLTPDEQTAFDKALECIEYIADVKPTPKILALDTALMAGLLCVVMPQNILNFIFKAINHIILEAGTLHILTRGSHGRINRN